MPPLTQTPVRISSDAISHVNSLGLQEAFQELIDKAVECLPALRRLEIGLQYSHDGDIPRVLFDAVVPASGEEMRAEDVQAEDAWYEWRSAHYPQQVSEHFILLVIPDFPDAR